MVRSRILRDTNAGPGIVSINGSQKSFILEQHWRSSTPPKVGGIVDVELNDLGEIVSVTAVDDAALAKEQAQKALDIASVEGRKYAGMLISKVGIPTLVAVALMALGWLILPTFSIQVSSAYRESISFYQVLKVINNSAGLDSLGNIDALSVGVWGWLMFAALLAPLLPHFHSNKYLPLGYAAPLMLILVVVLQTYISIRDSVSQARDLAGGFGGAKGAAMAERMMSEMMNMAFKAVSLGAGLYIAAAVSLYLAFIGIRKFLASSAKV